MMTELTAEATAPPDLTDQPGRFRTASHVVGLITVACILATAFGRDESLRILSGFLAAMFALFALLFYGSDLVSPAVRNRRTGLAAVKCYFGAVRWRRWQSALCCLSTIARRRPAAMPSLPELDCSSFETTFISAKEVKRYWMPLAHSKGGRTRRITALRYRPILVEPTVERYWVDIDIEHYPSLIMLLILVGVLPYLIAYLIVRRTQSLSFPITVLKYRSQWWLLSGEVYPRVDRALAALPAMTA